LDWHWSTVALFGRACIEDCIVREGWFGVGFGGLNGWVGGKWERERWWVKIEMQGSEIGF
jgi:hypothetical protein